MSHSYVTVTFSDDMKALWALFVGLSHSLHCYYHIEVVSMTLGEFKDALQQQFLTCKLNPEKCYVRNSLLQYSNQNVDLFKMDVSSLIDTYLKDSGKNGVFVEYGKTLPNDLMISPCALDNKSQFSALKNATVIKERGNEFCTMHNYDCDFNYHMLDVNRNRAFWLHNFYTFFDFELAYTRKKMDLFDELYLWSYDGWKWLFRREKVLCNG